MGQYHLLINLDKKVYLHPHKLGDGLKLMEFGSSAGGAMTALALLLSCSNGRGGGDFRGSDPEGAVGSWAGDRIAIVGDYQEAGDLPDDYPTDLYERCTEGEYTDISAYMRGLIESDGEYRFIEDPIRIQKLDGTIDTHISIRREYADGSPPSGPFGVQS